MNQPGLPEHLAVVFCSIRPLFKERATGHTSGDVLAEPSKDIKNLARGQMVRVFFKEYFQSRAVSSPEL
jgi:hypothetical protein